MAWDFGEIHSSEDYSEALGSQSASEFGATRLRRERLAEILAEREGFEPSMSYQPILP